MTADPFGSDLGSCTSDPLVGVGAFTFDLVEWRLSGTAPGAIDPALVEPEPDEGGA